MDLGLNDRVVLVTGASAGIGLAAAESFRKEGARVAICSRDESKLALALRQHVSYLIFEIDRQINSRLIETQI